MEQVRASGLPELRRAKRPFGYTLESTSTEMPPARKDINSKCPHYNADFVAAAIVLFAAHDSAGPGVLDVRRLHRIGSKLANGEKRIPDVFARLRPMIWNVKTSECSRGPLLYLALAVLAGVSISLVAAQAIHA